MPHMLFGFKMPIFFFKHLLFSLGEQCKLIAVTSHCATKDQESSFFKRQRKFLLFYELIYINIMLFSHLCQVKIGATTTALTHHAKIIHS